MDEKVSEPTDSRKVAWHRAAAVGAIAGGIVAVIDLLFGVLSMKSNGYLLEVTLLFSPWYAIGYMFAGATISVLLQPLFRPANSRNG